MLLLVIMLGLAGVRLTRDRGDIVRDEASRLVVLLQNAHQQAILEGRLYRFNVTREGYEFRLTDVEGKLQSIKTSDPLAPHRLPYPVTLNTLRSADQPNVEIDFDPSGDFTAFTLVLRFDEIVWYVLGSSDGKIRATTELPPTAA